MADDTRYLINHTRATARRIIDRAALAVDIGVLKLDEVRLLSMARQEAHRLLLDGVLEDMAPDELAAANRAITAHEADVAFLANRSPRLR